MTLRAYVPAEQWKHDAIALPQEEAHHLVSVRRAQPGDVVEVMDGKGRVAHGTLTELGKRRALVQTNDVVTSLVPAVSSILVPAIMDASRWDWFLQKATELGAAAIYPLITDRTQERKKIRMERWHNVLVAAMKQSGNPWLPALSEPQSLEAVFQEVQQDDLLLFGALEGSDRFTDVTAGCKPGQRIFSFTGPEGGFTDGEARQLTERGAIPVRLASHTLRAETAAIAFQAGISMTILPFEV